MATVLDASALLAVFRHETGAELVQRSLLQGGCVVSSVNLVETLTRLSDLGMLGPETPEEIEELGVQIVAFGREEAIAAATLRTATAHRGLSLGDRACLALALALDAEVLTTDRAWAQVTVGARVRLIR